MATGSSTSTALNAKPTKAPVRRILSRTRKQVIDSALPLWEHQRQTLTFALKSPVVFDTSDPGTGKTRAHLEAFQQRWQAGSSAKCLILAPKSLLRTAWFQDASKFTPELRCSIAYATNREKAFDEPADVYITNLDAVKWLVKQPKAWLKAKFPLGSTLIIDECFVAGTQVDTPIGPRNIESLNPGDLVMTSQGYLPISHTIQHESNDLYEIEFDDGTIITCTGNHPFATKKGWRFARSIGGMRILRLNLHRAQCSSPSLLQQNMQHQSPLDHQTRNNDGRQQEGQPKTSRSTFLEQGNSLVGRIQNGKQLTRKSSTKTTKDSGRKWKDSALRADDDRDAAARLGIPASNSNQTAQNLGIPHLLQGRLCQSNNQASHRSRRVKSSIAKSLGCQKGFLSGYARVVRVTPLESTGNRSVYNLQVNGPHDYSVHGFLVHNCTAFKHRTSQRTKAAMKLSQHFTYRVGLTGTPNPRSVTELWAQLFVLDHGAHLGKNFFQFRSATQTPNNRGAFTQWEDKPGIELAVAQIIADVSVRHEFEKCLSIPPNHTYTRSFSPNDALFTAYEEMRDTCLLELEKGTIKAVNAAVLQSKLLQILSGASYGDDGYHLIDTERYELIADLIEEVQHSVTFFNWRHQKDLISKHLTERDISHAVLDGSIPIKQRETIVRDYQSGELQTVLLHPQTGAHGLTLTRGTRTIWSSPIFQADFLVQGRHRIYRGGQTQRTETVLVCAEDTIEEEIYDRLNGREKTMNNFLEMLKEGK